MSWLAITSDHIKARLSNDELCAYVDAAQPAESGVDAIAGIIAQVTAMVRGKVASCRANLAKMGSAGTIPSECLFAACTIARDALVGSLPLSEGSTEVRREELRKAHEFLTSIASCEVTIESPDGTIPEAVQSSTSYPSYGGAALLDF
jgi:hypothetical protein